MAERELPSDSACQLARLVAAERIDPAQEIQHRSEAFEGALGLDDIGTGGGGHGGCVSRREFED